MCSDVFCAQLVGIVPASIKESRASTIMDRVLEQSHPAGPSADTAHQLLLFPEFVEILAAMSQFHEPNPLVSTAVHFEEFLLHFFLPACLESVPGLRPALLAANDAHALFVFE